MSDFQTRLAASQLLKVVAQAANNDEDRAAVELLHSLIERDHKSEMNPPPPVHVFTFISDELPNVNDVIPFDTRAEALAFVQGFEYWDDGESIALIWPFVAPDRIAAVVAEIDADAIMVNVHARVAALGLEDLA